MYAEGINVSWLTLFVSLFATSSVWLWHAGENIEEQGKRLKRESLYLENYVVSIFPEIWGP